ncbi:DUF2680 domain-containing protein [Thermotalea metallivorans]|uniref:DUF2680 domain-containing protein n=1 Tax=Thermotalea metallivorans TaxID=520762 RepID=A0A140LCG2_9FIRM|nr:DUF2680 domain-containing protein [Thermotalea metallivorans]KXG78237.1 hypothetical protein AN619_02120 [Thermotalea metallivorans]
MKKIIILSIVAVMILSLGLVAFAETQDTKEIPVWFTEMIKWKKEQIQKALDAKQITEEQAKFFNERLDAMEKYHKENGFNFPAGCGMGGGFGKGGRGFGGGMMRGFFGPAPQTNSF